MKVIKNNNGITLMVLVITIIILIILASVGTYSGIQVVKSSQLTAFSTELKIMQTHVNKLYEERTDEQISEIGKPLSTVQSQVNTVFASSTSGVTDSAGYRYFDKETIQSLNIEGVEGEFFVNVKKRSVVSYDGFVYEGKTYYTLDQLPDGFYNVDYESDESNKPTFDIVTSYKDKDECLLSVKNIKYNGNISKWNLKYKLEEEQDFKETKELNVKLDKEGNYKIKITNGNFESEEITKTIYLPRDSKYVENKAEDYYGHYVTNYNSPNDLGINAEEGKKWQVFMSDDDNIYLISSNYISREYTGTKNNIGYDYTASIPTMMWFTSIINQYNADTTKTDIPEILSELDKQAIYYKWMNNPENQTRNYNNEKAVASILDSNIWGGYKNSEYAKYTIGSPTLEMLCKGYNDSHTGDKLYAQETNPDNTNGYRVKKGSSDASDDVTDLKTGAKNNLVDGMYFKSTNKGNFYWLAAPSAKSSNRLLYVNSGGYINYYGYDNTNFGFLPIVCLKSNTHLIMNDDEETYSVLNI